jgi:hypothetical protein
LLLIRKHRGFSFSLRSQIALLFPNRAALRIAVAPIRFFAAFDDGNVPWSFARAVGGKRPGLETALWA